jgi:hypothetical protein
MKRRLDRVLVACVALATTGCVDAVQSGQPALVSGCSQDIDCPVGFLCGISSPGACEQFLCPFYCDGGVGGAPAFSGCPGPAFACIVGSDLGSGFGISYCAAGVASTSCSCAAEHCDLHDGGAPNPTYADAFCCTSLP